MRKSHTGHYTPSTSKKREALHKAAVADYNFEKHSLMPKKEKTWKKGEFDHKRAKHPRRVRQRRVSKPLLETLWIHFRHTRNVDARQVQMLAQCLDLSPNQVKNWFQRKSFLYKKCFHRQQRSAGYVLDLQPRQQQYQLKFLPGTKAPSFTFRETDQKPSLWKAVTQILLCIKDLLINVSRYKSLELAPVSSVINSIFSYVNSDYMYLSAHLKTKTNKNFPL
ncbi:uncharacterized protein LOC119543344 [Choloepus didactylus]|uniref:uncharacterized protein LOC119543344 n=1 Tax=Choloepus didactylus TaxID=27675 RepID=UPI00189FE085|nr:uncharacterized protein LOC119543344 [Choloepus didactylus]